MYYRKKGIQCSERACFLYNLIRNSQQQQNMEATFLSLLQNARWRQFFLFYYIESLLLLLLLLEAVCPYSHQGLKYYDIKLTLVYIVYFNKCGSQSCSAYLYFGNDNWIKQAQGIKKLLTNINWLNAKAAFGKTINSAKNQPR